MPAPSGQGICPHPPATHTSDQLATNSGVPTISSSSIITWNDPQRLRKALQLWLQFYYQGYTEGKVWERTQSFFARLWGNQGISPSGHINVFTNQEAPLTFSIQGFHWDFITWACFIKSLATWSNSISSPLLLPLLQRSSVWYHMVKASNPLITWLVFLA